MFTFILFFISNVSSATYVSVRYVGKQYVIVPGIFDPTAAARGILIENLSSTGWHDIHVESGVGLSDTVQAHAAGMVEGFLSQTYFWPNINNLYYDMCDEYIECETRGLLPSDVCDFFQQNLAWVQKTVDDDKTETYWAMTVILEQLEGMVDGYNYQNSEKEVKLLDLWIYHCRSEIFDVYRKLRNVRADKEPTVDRRGTYLINHIHENGKSLDLSIGHSSWRSYSNANRFSKRYRMHYPNTFSMTDRRAMSGYPMLLHSDEGLTINSNQIIVSATSIAILNDDLYKNIGIQGFPHWLRAMMADLVSFSGDEWAKLYSSVSNGACGVEYLIVDTKRFIYREGLLPHTLTVVDEIPGLIKTFDATESLRKSQYFASYDVPFDSEVFRSAGYDTLSQKAPYLYSYNESSRAKIFKEKVNGKNLDANQFRKLMRYNDPTDPLLEGKLDRGISPRQEIPGKSDNMRCAGGIDAKLTSVGRALHLHWEGAAGPYWNEAEGLPKFNFLDSGVCSGVNHSMIPNELAFKWYPHYFDIDV